MIVFLRHLFGWVLSTFGSRKNLVLENLALRQQLLAFHSKRPRRRFSTTQKLFWVVLRRFWSGWQKPLVLITPRTVIVVAPCRLPAVLEVLIESATTWRSQTLGQRNSSP